MTETRTGLAMGGSDAESASNVKRPCLTQCVMTTCYIFQNDPNEPQQSFRKPNAVGSPDMPRKTNIPTSEKNETAGRLSCHLPQPSIHQPRGEGAL